MPNYNRANPIYQCADCGHSIDLHGVGGCRVVGLFTKEKCSCKRFSRVRRLKSDETLTDTDKPRAQRKGPGRPPLDDDGRGAKMAEMQKKGMTYVQIAQEFGLSRQRVYQLLSRYKKRNETS